jgi:hypothetical protein
MTDTYSPQQVLDALKRQGFSDEQAMGMYQAMGGMRRSSPQIKAGYGAVGAQGADLPTGRDGEQDSGLMPNLAEGVASTAAFGALNKHMPNIAGEVWKNRARGAGRFLGTGVAGNLATLGTIALTDNNFYDTATMPQLAGDVGGSIAGGVVGDYALRAGAKKVVESVAKNAGAAGLKGVAARGGQVAGALASRAGAALVGRAGGATLGSVLGPIGSVAGAALGGWLIPKLFEKGSTSVDEDIMNDVIKRKKKSVYGEYS